MDLPCVSYVIVSILLLLLLHWLFSHCLSMLHCVIVFCPPFSVVPIIALVVDTLQVRLKLKYAYIVDEHTLRNELLDGMRAVRSYVPYFEHVGFWRTEE